MRAGLALAADPPTIPHSVGENAGRTQLPSDVAAPEPALELRDLLVVRGGRVAAQLSYWRLEAGGQALLLGASGSGKTTLLQVIAGMLQPTEGEVAVLGKHLRRLGQSALDRFRARHIGFVFQTLHLVRALDVLGNLRLAGFLAGRRASSRELVHLLAQMGLADRARARVGELSQGEAQRVAIARALVNRPRLLLADEPTSALDDVNAARVLGLMRELAGVTGAALLIATHDRRLEPHMANRVVLDATP